MKNPFARRMDPLIGKLELLDEADTDSLMRELRTSKAPTILGFLNQHAYNIAQRHRNIYEGFFKVNYLLRDGIGIKMACWLNGVEPKANLNGSDFIPRLIESLIESSEERYELFALGTQEPWLSDGAKALFGNRPFHAMDGFRKVDDYLRFVTSRHVEGRFPIIVLAMGMPKQEQVAVQLRDALNTPALLICGGAILDFAAERFPRAPLWMRRFGLEWLFRLLLEPRRLFKRYALGIPLFFYYLSRNSFGKQRNNDDWEGVERER